MYKKLLLSFFILFIAGCATIISTTNQYIQVRIVDAKTQESLSDFRCIITEGSGIRHTLTSEGSVMVSRSNSPLQVTCTKDGYAATQMGLGSSFNPVTFINVLTAFSGFIVDAVTGAMYGYPSHFTVYMDKK